MSLIVSGFRGIYNPYFDVGRKGKRDENLTYTLFVRGEEKNRKTEPKTNKPNHY